MLLVGEHLATERRGIRRFSRSIKLRIVGCFQAID